MIATLQRTSIGQRVVALALLPLLVLTTLATTDLRRLDRARRDAATVVALTRLADQTGRAVHALERERGATSLFVSSRGSTFAAELTGGTRESSNPTPRNAGHSTSTEPGAVHSRIALGAGATRPDGRTDERANRTLVPCAFGAVASP